MSSKPDFQPALSPIKMSLYDTATILSDEFLYEFEKHAVRGVEKTACLEKNILGHGRCRRASYSVEASPNYLVFRGRTINAFNHTFIPESAELVAHYEPNGIAPGKFIWDAYSQEVARIRLAVSLREFQKKSVMVRQKDAYRLMIVMTGVLKADGMYFHRMSGNNVAVYLIRDARLPEVKMYQSGNVLQFTDRSYRQLITKFAVNPRHVMLEYFDTVKQLRKQKSLDDDGNVIGLKVTDDKGASIAYTFDKVGALIGTAFDGVDPLDDRDDDIDYDTNYDSEDDDVESVWSLDIANETTPEEVNDDEPAPAPAAVVLPSTAPDNAGNNRTLRPEVSVQEEIVAATPLVPPFDSSLYPVKKENIIPTIEDLRQNSVVPPMSNHSFVTPNEHRTAGGPNGHGPEAGSDDETEKRRYSDDAGAAPIDNNNRGSDSGIINTLKNMWPFSKGKQAKPDLRERERSDRQDPKPSTVQGNPSDFRHDQFSPTNDVSRSNPTSLKDKKNSSPAPHTRHIPNENIEHDKTPKIQQERPNSQPISPFVHSTPEYGRNRNNGKNDDPEPFGRTSPIRSNDAQRLSDPFRSPDIDNSRHQLLPVNASPSSLSDNDLSPIKSNKPAKPGSELARSVPSKLPYPASASDQPDAKPLRWPNINFDSEPGSGQGWDYPRHEPSSPVDPATQPQFSNRLLTTTIPENAPTVNDASIPSLPQHSDDGRDFGPVQQSDRPESQDTNQAGAHEIKSPGGDRGDTRPHHEDKPDDYNDTGRRPTSVSWSSVANRMPSAAGRPAAPVSAIYGQNDADEIGDENRDGSEPKSWWNRLLGSKKEPHPDRRDTESNPSSSQHPNLNPVGAVEEDDDNRSSRPQPVDTSSNNAVPSVKDGDMEQVPIPGDGVRARPDRNLRDVHEHNGVNQSVPRIDVVSSRQDAPMESHQLSTPQNAGVVPKEAKEPVLSTYPNMDEHTTDGKTQPLLNAFFGSPESVSKPSVDNGRKQTPVVRGLDRGAPNYDRHDSMPAVKPNSPDDHFEQQPMHNRDYIDEQPNRDNADEQPRASPRVQRPGLGSSQIDHKPDINDRISANSSIAAIPVKPTKNSRWPFLRSSPKDDASEPATLSGARHPYDIARNPHDNDYQHSKDVVDGSAVRPDGHGNGRPREHDLVAYCKPQHQAVDQRDNPNSDSLHRSDAAPDRQIDGNLWPTFGSASDTGTPGWDYPRSDPESLSDSVIPQQSKVDEQHPEAGRTRWPSLASGSSAGTPPWDYPNSVPRSSADSSEMSRPDFPKNNQQSPELERTRWPSISANPEADTPGWNYRGASTDANQLRRPTLADIQNNRPESPRWPSITSDSDVDVPGWDYPRSDSESFQQRSSLFKIDERRPSHFDHNEPNLLPIDNTSLPKGRHSEHNHIWPESDVAHRRLSSSRTPMLTTANRMPIPGRTDSHRMGSSSADVDHMVRSPPATHAPSNNNSRSVPDRDDPDRSQAEQHKSGPRDERDLSDSDLYLKSSPLTYDLTPNADHTRHEDASPDDLKLPSTEPSASYSPENTDVDSTADKNGPSVSKPKHLLNRLFGSGKTPLFSRPNHVSKGGVTQLEKKPSSLPVRNSPGSGLRDIPDRGGVQTHKQPVDQSGAVDKPRNVPVKFSEDDNHPFVVLPVENPVRPDKFVKDAPDRLELPLGSSGSKPLRPADASSFVQKPDGFRGPINNLPATHDVADDVLDKKRDTFRQEPSPDGKPLLQSDDHQKTKSPVADSAVNSHPTSNQKPDRDDQLDIFRPEPSSDGPTRKDSTVSDGALRKRSKNHPNLSSLFLDALERAERNKEQSNSLKDEQDPLQGNSDESDGDANDHEVPEATPLERLALCCSWLCGNPTPESQH